MQLKHSGETYECNVAVKCESDKYIKLYDANGVEIASFNHISDFSDYTLSGGSFTPPSNCSMPIEVTTYIIGERVIAINDWVLEDGKYKYTITHNLISANCTTCDILLIFAKGTILQYEAEQKAGELVLYTESIPASDITIESIKISRI